MNSITFTGAYGDTDKLVELSFVLGGYFHIYIDRFYQGQILCINNKWTVKLHNPETMSIDDVQIIQGIISHGAIK